MLSTPESKPWILEQASQHNIGCELMLKGDLVKQVENKTANAINVQNSSQDWFKNQEFLLTLSELVLAFSKQTSLLRRMLDAPITDRDRDGRRLNFIHNELTQLTSDLRNLEKTACIIGNDQYLHT
ncbi:MAG: hypothetical protein R3C03_13125 [Pirellulaceae bacterium]